MQKRAQVALEYMVTYSWALILVITVVAVLVFVVMGPAPPEQIVSKEPNKLLMKASAITDGVAEIKIQNITGGRIKITDISLSQGFKDTDNDAEINRQPITDATAVTPIEIFTGNNMHFTGIDYLGDEIGELTISYLDYAGLERSTTIIASN